MNIKRATKSYETWLAEQTLIVPADLARKHDYMAQGKASGLFVFFRATFYRWAQLWPKRCPELSKAPALLAVGDLHVENFGTWHNAEGQLVWGVNDFDEAAILPYTADLVRLATSANLAIRADLLDIPRRKIYEHILNGYLEGLRTGGHRYVLNDQHEWLRRLTTMSADRQAQWLKELLDLPTAQEPVPPGALAVLERLMPEPNLPYRIVRREAGTGSLGRQRWTAIATWQGQPAIREVKALVPSAWLWAAQQKVNETLVGTLLSRAVRSPDPYVRVEAGWITRRLAPDNRRVNLDTLSNTYTEQLMYAMGRETANIHLGSPEAIEAVLRDLAARPPGWLPDAAQTMAQAIADDWKEWRRDYERKG